jgi:hypothetical protein
MTAMPVEEPISFEEFLELEEQADWKHEYVDGFMHAFAGALRPHNRIGVPVPRLDVSLSLDEIYGLTTR